MRYVALLLSLAALAGCHRGADNQEAIRQGVIDYLSTRTNLNMAAMNVSVASVVFRGEEADAVISFAPKGAAPSQGMEMRYSLERKGARWVVKNRTDVGTPHGAGAMGANPHGGGMPGGAMPGGSAMPGGGMPAGHPPVDSTKK